MIKTSSRPPRAELEAGLENLTDSVYLPTIEDRKLKSEFWAKSRDTLALQTGGKQISLAQATEFVSAPKRLVSAWSRPGFKEWFTNGDEHRQRMEYLFDLSLDAAENILRDPDPKTSSAKVNLIKLLAELNKKFPRQLESEKKDYSKLSAEEIQTLLGEAGIKVSVESKTTYEPAIQIDVTPPTKE